MTEVQRESDPWSLQAELRHAVPITVIPVRTLIHLINFTVPASQKKNWLASILTCKILCLAYICLEEIYTILKGTW